MSRFILVPVLIFSAAIFADDPRSPKQDEGHATLKTLRHDLEMYKTDCGRFPSTKDGLEALSTPPPKSSCANWGPDYYIKRIPQDPWGREWHYSSDGKSFKIWSLGADGREGGVGDDVDMMIQGT